MVEQLPLKQTVVGSNPTGRTMNTKALGKIRKGDVPAIMSVIKIFKSAWFSCALHGTSLWNKNYKDIDLVVFPRSSRAGGVGKFLVALEQLKKSGAKIKTARGNEKIGFDYDIDFSKTRLHVSYVNVL